MSKQTISLDIASCNLGENTDEDNAAYRLAVQEEIESRFPGTDVDVSTVGGIFKDVAIVTGFDDAEETESTVKGIAEDVWSEGNW